jgi:hypothetical protein
MRERGYLGAKMKRAAIIILSGFFVFAGPQAFAQWALDLEGGAVFSGYNDVQVPGRTGTRFSLSKELKTDPAFFYRVRLTYSFGSRHHISALVAPLRLHAKGEVDRAVRFNQVEFDPRSPLKARYRFDSYRLTYRYDFLGREALRAGIGFTAKIRDASISLEDDQKKTEKKNTGFVPLLNFKMEWMFSEPLGILLEGDGLAAPQGRAEDVLLALQYHATRRVVLRAGYRVLEGGVDVDEVYNFTLVHYVIVGLQGML